MVPGTVHGSSTNAARCAAHLLWQLLSCRGGKQVLSCLASDVKICVAARFTSQLMAAADLDHAFGQSVASHLWEAQVVIISPVQLQLASQISLPPIVHYKRKLPYVKGLLTSVRCLQVKLLCQGSPLAVYRAPTTATTLRTDVMVLETPPSPASGLLGWTYGGAGGTGTATPLTHPRVSPLNAAASNVSSSHTGSGGGVAAEKDSNFCFAQSLKTGIVQTGWGWRGGGGPDVHLQTWQQLQSQDSIC